MNFTSDIQCELVDACASDLAVVNAARISFDHEHPQMKEGDDKLISFLLRNRHMSPFEHGYFKFRIEAPIFVFREHHRHRVGQSYNEMSGRYTELESKFYIPETARTQEGKPGQYTFVEQDPKSEITSIMHEVMIESYEHAWESYQFLLRTGVAKEQARMVLPVGIFSKMIWSCNPRSLMHFLGLRLAPNAQKEIRMVAQAAEKHLKDLMPVTYQAFVDNGHSI